MRKTRIPKKELLNLLDGHLKEEDALLISFSTHSENNVIYTHGELWPQSTQIKNSLVIEIEQIIK
jgi:hypothetical protein